MWTCADYLWKERFIGVHGAPFSYEARVSGVEASRDRLLQPRVYLRRRFLMRRPNDGCLLCVLANLPVSDTTDHHPTMHTRIKHSIVHKGPRPPPPSSPPPFLNPSQWTPSHPPQPKNAATPKASNYPPNPSPRHSDPSNQTIISR